MLCLQVKSPSRPRDTDKTALYARKAYKCGPRKQTYGRSHQFHLPLKKKKVWCVLWKTILLRAYKLQLVQDVTWTTMHVIRVFLQISRETGTGWCGGTVCFVT